MLGLVQLQEERGSTVPIRGIVNDLCPTERAGLLPIEPGSDAQFAEDVITLEQHRRVEVVVADGALSSTGLQLLLRWDRSVARFLQKLDNRPFAELNAIEQVR